MNYEDCDGCFDEMLECFEWQQKGYDAGLEIGVGISKGHCFVFVLNKDGENIVC